MLRLDGWINALTGIGGARDKASYGAFTPHRVLSLVELDNLYHFNDFARTICESIPSEAMR